MFSICCKFDPNFQSLIIKLNFPMKLPKELTKNKLLLDRLIYRMRIQNVDVMRPTNTACMTYKAIAAIVGNSISYCQKVCRQQLKRRLATATISIMKSRSKKLVEAELISRPSKLNALHLEHLTSGATLKRQIGMSLAERAADFSRCFPSKKISSTTLARIYKKHAVRKKKVRVTKLPNKKERKKIKRSTEQAKADLEHYQWRGFRIIYIDETMITKSTIGTHEWSKKHQNYEMDMKSYAKETIAVLAGVSK